MNPETKRHIDGARQVLVGVVPNPTSQIDQITYALIYKFMDDMDQYAIKEGGSASFFVGDLIKYSWTRIMDTKLGNQERMSLYGDAFQHFAEAEHVPELFRGILKSAFLPYRSPEVLWLFLKEIDYFDYSHPEELGNAYEYLLSIMGSQGDAGQFRTPRHIIDFIVDILNPGKDDKILDPACGTGGFLVKSYQHILESHLGEGRLTPSQKQSIMNQFEGYDIDPGMVRIAQVNMFLHQFKSPKIVQYDTLSMEERWQDKFDVIMANPPFMSPKGGIKPHSKFSVPSTRSEVLFVDYIMNHLKPRGRAGIIVPEGIIFQSGTAYKQLRKNLVGDGLYAVVSLPSGVFQPYSGVKTSILLFDNTIAKMTDSFLFVKVESDGFDMGAQRRPTSKNDLPQALEIIKEFQSSIGEVFPQKSVPSNPFSLLIPKSRIAENGDYNLSGDRYRVATDYSHAKWPMVKLETISNLIQRGKSPVYGDSNIQVIKSGQARGYFDFDFSTKYFVEKDFPLDHRQLQKGDLLINSTGVGTAGRITLFNLDGTFLADGHITIVRINEQQGNSIFVLYVLDSIYGFKGLEEMAQGNGGQIELGLSIIKNLTIPLPPLEIQQQIVTELDGYQSIIAGAKQIISNWKPTIDINPTWTKVKLGEVLNFIGSGATPLGGKDVYVEDGILFIRSQNVLWGETDFSDAVFINEDTHKEMSRSQVKNNDVLLNITGASIGRCAIFKESLEANVNQHVTILRCKEGLNSNFLMLNILGETIQNTIWSIQSGASRQALNYQQIREIEIPLPPLEIQQQIVERIESERVLVESAKKLITLYTQKISTTLAKLWEE